MCGRFTLLELPPVSERFGLHLLEEIGRLQARFNIAPSQDVAAIIEGEQGRELHWMVWGYQPGWFKRKPGQPPPINARAETLLERSMFRGAVGKTRCLIPADGFYEWQAVPGQRSKQPMYIRLKGGRLFAFAGLYTEKRDELTGEPVPSCAIVTTAPN
jgi:putative SOS response-associated peptidase YedK